MMVKKKKSQRIEKILMKSGSFDENTINYSRQVPFDSESKLEVATVLMPIQIEEKKTLFYNESLRQQIDEFIDSYKESDRLASYG